MKQSTESTQATESNTPPFRWAVLGAGDVCRRKSGPALAGVQGSKIELVYRRNSEQARGFVNLVGQGRVAKSLEQILDSKEIHGVYVATPHELHEEQTLACLRAGKHVLVEKPMALNTEGCTRMVEEAHRAGVLLGVAYYRRGYPSIQKIKAILASGLVGTPVSMALCNEFPTSHRIDLVHYLLGSVAQVRITGAGNNPFAPENVQEKIVLRTTSGVEVQMASGWLETGMAESLVLRCETGSILLDDLKSGVLRVQSPNETIQLKVPDLPWTHWGIVENFVRAARNGVDLLCSGQEGRKSTVILDFLARAVPGGEPVTVEYPG